jgi:hypothetical protein
MRPRTETRAYSEVAPSEPTSAETIALTTTVRVNGITLR